MAGDWIKLETTTPDKPEVFQIAEALQIDPDAVLGKLIRVWVWADQQSRDGHAPSVTKTVLDRVAHVTGFADALITCGWLEDAAEGLTFPNFDYHNGQTAKARALAAKRKQNERGKSHDSVTAPSRSQRDVQRDKNVTREEKRREEEEKKKPPNPLAGGTDPNTPGPEPPAADLATMPEKLHQMPRELDNAAFRGSWAEWIANRKEKRFKAYTDRGAAMQLKKLAEFGTAAAIAAIETAIRNGWQGLFPEKESGATRGGYKTAAEKQNEYAAATLLDAMGITDDGRKPTADRDTDRGRVVTVQAGPNNGRDSRVHGQAIAGNPDTRAQAGSVAVLGVLGESVDDSATPSNAVARMDS